ncbi:MAG: Antidote-toxin recognition MazE, bacterial antitoxin [Solirubrobacterales bacterium]|nr:Antidote-toxin recognition MazE, bacterial antitoxin [Solirubrobacterales bacterium]
MIPAETRRRLNLKSGDRLTIREEDGEIRLLPITDRITALRGAWADKAGQSAVEQLRKERRMAAKRE